MSWPPERRAYSPVMTRRNRDARATTAHRATPSLERTRDYSSCGLANRHLFRNGFSKIIFLSNVFFEDILEEMR